MIIGIGSDIIQIPRIDKIIENFGIKFLNKIFTENEIENSAKYTNHKLKISYYAKRFAAKEAFVKALGIGFRMNIKFKDIEIVNSELGKPGIRLLGEASNLLNKKANSYKIDLTLSDDYPVAIAFVVISS